MLDAENSILRTNKKRIRKKEKITLITALVKYLE